MRKQLILAAALAAFASPAIAADLPIPAKSAFNLAYPYSGGSGFYFGVNTMAGIADASANSTILSGTMNAAGAAVGGTAGWTTGNQSLWLAIEASGDYQNVTATATNAAASVASCWSSEQVVKLGGSAPLQYLAALAPLGINFPTFSLPAVPSGISVAASPHPYIMGGVKEFGISGGFGVAGGSTVGVAPLLGAGMIYQIVDKSGTPTRMALDLGAEAVFANKGLGFANVFGTGGPVTPATISMGNQFFAYAKVLF